MPSPLEPPTPTYADRPHPIREHRISTHPGSSHRVESERVESERVESERVESHRVEAERAGSQRPGTHRAAVVVPAHNVERVLGLQLDALAPQLAALSAEIVIIDDASTDATARIARQWAEHHPDLTATVVRSDTRGGPNASRNRGLRATAAPIVCFTDGDDVVEPGWLASLVTAAEHHPLVGGGYRVLPTRPDDAVGEAVGEVVREPFDLVGVPFPPGSCMAVQRWIVDRVGGFDENIRRGGTEADFFVRVFLTTGMTYRFADGAVVGYRVEPGWRNDVRRHVTRARGQAYLSCRLRHDPRLPAPVTHSLHTSARQMATAALRIVTGPGRGEHVARSAGAAARVFWLARYRMAPPTRT